MGLILLVVAVAEIWSMIQVAQLIGGWYTLGLLVLQFVVGAWIVKLQGLATFQRVARLVAARDVPGSDLLRGFLMIPAGLLLMVPGFFTTVAGLILLLPPVRSFLCRVIIDRFRNGTYGRIFVAVGNGATFVGRVRGGRVLHTPGMAPAGRVRAGPPPELPR